MRLRHIPFTNRPFSRDIPIGILASILLLFINISLALILLITGVVRPGQDISNATSITTQYTDIAILAVLLIASAVIEEVFFRGFLMEYLKRYKGPVFAIIITSILFGLSHALYLQPYTVLVTGIMGLILGYLVIRTNSILTGITAHTTYNILLLILLTAF